MLNSWQIPVSVLAAWGFFRYIIPVISEYTGKARPQWNSQYMVRAVTISVILLAALTNLYLFAWRFVDLARHDYPYYLYRDEVATLKWLDENTAPENIVFSSLTIGQYIPAFSGNTAFLAHWASTVDFYYKQNLVSRFFDPATPDEERIQTLEAFGVDYVFYGPAERALGDYDPATSSWLELAFSRPQVNIYRVKDEMLMSVRSVK